VKIKIAGVDSNSGGGSTFVKNFITGIKRTEHIITDACDVFLISGATICDRAEVEQAKHSGKKIVLRVDNILEDSKNRNTGMPRMIYFAKMADLIIYQSAWAKHMLSPYCGEGIIIYNGVDCDVFYPRKKDWNGIRVFYGRASRSELKNFHSVQYFWRSFCIKSLQNEGKLVIAGNFGDESLNINHKFEFHNSEPFEFYGKLGTPELAEVIRGCDIALLPYQFDACSNLILECQASGLPVIYSPTGGTPEIISVGVEFGTYAEDIVEVAMSKKVGFKNIDFRDYWGIERMIEEYIEAFKKLL
jgi:glycosyltransferase involved in cell wall biosynthesis